MKKTSIDILVDEAEKNAEKIGISPEELLSECLEIANLMVANAPTVIADINNTLSDIAEKQQALEKEIARGAGKTHGSRSFLL